MGDYGQLGIQLIHITGNVVVGGREGLFWMILFDISVLCNTCCSTHMEKKWHNKN